MEVRDDIMKDNLTQIQKSVSELNTMKKEAGQGEKLTSEAPKPGERLVIVDSHAHFIMLVYLHLL